MLACTLASRIFCLTTNRRMTGSTQACSEQAARFAWGLAFSTPSDMPTSIRQTLRSHSQLAPSSCTQAQLDLRAAVCKQRLWVYSIKVLTTGPAADIAHRFAQAAREYGSIQRKGCRLAAASLCTGSLENRPLQLSAGLQLRHITSAYMQPEILRGGQGSGSWCAPGECAQ